MKKILGIVLMASAMIMTNAAVAGGLYVAGHVSSTKVDVDGEKLDSTAGVGLGLGYGVTNWLSAEITHDYLGNDDIAVGEEDVVSYKTYSTVGWIVANPTITKIGGMPLKAVGRIGYGHTKVESNVGDISDDHPAYGVGFSLGLSKSIDAYVDYRVLDTDVDDAEFRIANIGIKYSF